ncbi:alcohol dehydrogenase catalytic domain-containing protein [Cryobacterium sp. Y11]|uniref:alcohol dehydrogenase catalytic domain-containing protein n=1 Tax=Cryobacterium sp. Y11 TaxID=2045016 RepID=UPI000CE3ABB6|nr:alcohol dehydrogenase catalytic domain-containing protein [Cryobacterium sp. Y11]
MKAAVSTGVGQGFKIHDVELADPIGREVLVDVKVSGFCHSNLHLVTTDDGFTMRAFLDHEVAGIVSAVGSEIIGVSVGDPVVASLIQFCGTYKNCTAGRTFYCLSPKATLRGTENARVSENVTTMVQAFGIGGFAERVRMHENQPAVVNKEFPSPYAVSRVHR